MDEQQSGTGAIAGSDSRGRVGYWLLIALLCLVGVGKAVNTTLDPDLWWHLRVADQLREEGIHPLVDHISFASVREPWTPYSWLAELGMKWVWEATGFRGTILLQALAIVGIIVLMALASAELAGADRRLNAVIATALGAYLSLAYLSFRPATFAVFWLAVCAWLLIRDRMRGEMSRTVWLVVPITALLANVHLVVVVVPIWVGCLLIGAVWERFHGDVASGESSRRAIRYALLLVATIAACCANPMLSGMIRTAWHYQFHDVMVKSGLISEMTPIYSGIWGWATTALINVLIVIGMIHYRRVRVGEWIWLIAAAGMMLRLGRFAPMFALIAAPVFAATLPKLSDVVLQKKAVLAALVVVLGLGMIRAVLQFPRTGTLARFLDQDEVFRYPTKAADFVDKNVERGNGRLITDFTWGGYLGWRLKEKYQVLLDGRTQVYPDELWRMSYLGDEETRMVLIERSRADVAVIHKERSIYTKPLERMGWRTVYSDDRALVLVPPR